MSPAPFETSSTEVEGVRVIAVQGELDLSTAPDLEGLLDDAVQSGGGPVLIDLSACEFIDSTGIALIVRAWQRLEGGTNGNGSRLAICNHHDQVRRVFEVSGLDRSIPLHESREQGLAALKA